jgi:alpha/beta superfamily hydrolase
VVREPRAGFRAAAVLCHPHPVYGGTMDNRVVYRAAKAAQAAGLATLRFNFRGAGKSTGAYDRGAGEQKDVSAVIDWLAERYRGLPLVLIGFSFGAWVGLRVGSVDPRVRVLVGLGLPVITYDFGFLAANTKPTLFVSGARDEFCPKPEMERLAGTLPSTSSVVWVEGADHFFKGRIDQLQQRITSFLLSALPGGQG